MTSLPADQQILKERMRLSEMNFHALDRPDHSAAYFFVVENEEHEVLGVTALNANTEIEGAFYTLQRANIHQQSTTAQKQCSSQILLMSSVHKLPSNVLQVTYCTT